MVPDDAVATPGQDSEWRFLTPSFPLTTSKRNVAIGAVLSEDTQVTHSIQNLGDQPATGTRIFRDANGKKLLSKKFTVAPWSADTIDFPESARDLDVSVLTKMRRKLEFRTHIIERLVKGSRGSRGDVEVNVINGNNLK